MAPLRTKVVTTKSSLQSWNYINLINGKRIDGINQLVVGDITYLSTHGKRHYLFCLTDIYSGLIAGFNLGRRMRKEEALAALEMWASLRGEAALEDCTHHTDGEGQYFSDLYLSRLGSLGAAISRAADCLQNGYAEQRNGLIKHHFLPTLRAKTGRGIKQGFGMIMRFYNKERNQEALGWLSPEAYEQKVGEMAMPPSKKLATFEN